MGIGVGVPGGKENIKDSYTEEVPVGIEGITASKSSKNDKAHAHNKERSKERSMFELIPKAVNVSTGSEIVVARDEHEAKRRDGAEWEPESRNWDYLSVLVTRELVTRPH